MDGCPQHAKSGDQGPDFTTTCACPLSGVDVCYGKLEGMSWGLQEFRAGAREAPHVARAPAHKTPAQLYNALSVAWAAPWRFLLLIDDICNFVVNHGTASFFRVPIHENS